VFSQFYRVLNIRVALVGLEVWSDADKCAVTQDPFTTLHEFLDWRKLKLLPQRPHDNAQLIRYQINTFIQQGCIQLLKRTVKTFIMYIFLFQIFYQSKNPKKKICVPKSGYRGRNA